MELEAAQQFAQMGKFIGAGLACIGLGGAGIGVGHIAGNFLSGALRNPSAAPGQMANLGAVVTDEKSDWSSAPMPLA